MGLFDFVRKFRSYDAFAKTLDDFTTRTVTGGLVTIMSAAIIIFLIFMEYMSYSTVVWKPELVVDTSRKQHMDIHFNITFPKIPCFTVSVDILDVASEHQMNVVKSVKKVRLHPDGKIVNEALEKHNYTAADASKASLAKAAENVDPDYCGSCYGATTVLFDGTLSCCNSCEEVKEAYRSRGMDMPELDTIEQCMKDEWKARLNAQKNEGCNIHGFVTVNRIPGNFHFAPGYSFQVNSMHLHDLRAFPDMKFDFTHYIHYLAFGEYHPSLILPLNGVNKTGLGENDVFTYFIKVVSTEFLYLNSSMLDTNQYSVTQHHRQVQAGGSGLSGLYFNVEISPMVVIYREYRAPLSSFITQICAIVGGVYTIAGLLDAFVYTASKRLLYKQNMGKAI